MGLDVTSARFLMLCARSGVDFSRTLMLGRQELLADPQRLAIAAEECAFPLAPDAIAALLAQQPAYAEPFFTALGAKHVDSMDAATYESATIIHDLNRPVPTELKGRFTLVYDGGTIEHVFHFPMAMQNAMELVAVGGHLITVTAANNFMGHGFYQFSPELFYRILTPANGYVMEGLYLFELTGLGDFAGVAYAALDPAHLKRRALLRNVDATLLVLRARRIAEQPIFATTPQQSDYAALWGVQERPTLSPRQVATTKASRLRHKLGEALWPLRQARRALRFGASDSRFDREAYRRIRFDQTLLPELRAGAESAARSQLAEPAALPARF